MRAILHHVRVGVLSACLGPLCAAAELVDNSSDAGATLLRIFTKAAPQHALEVGTRLFMVGASTTARARLLFMRRPL